MLGHIHSHPGLHAAHGLQVGHPWSEYLLTKTMKGDYVRREKGKEICSWYFNKGPKIPTVEKEKRGIIKPMHYNFS